MASGVLLVGVIADALLDRCAQQVAFLTPFIVLTGSGGIVDQTAGLACERVLTTLLGAALAAAVALVLARAAQDADRSGVEP